MKYFLLSFIVACKLSPFSTPRDAGLIVSDNTHPSSDFYLQIEGGVALVKENDNRVVTFELHELELRQPQNSYAVNSADNAQLIDGIDNVIIDSYQGKPRLLHLDKVKFSITPRADQPYVYTCVFSDVVLGKVKFRVDTEASKRQASKRQGDSEHGCTSNHHTVAQKQIIRDKCSEYAAVDATSERDQLRYHSSDFNDGKVLGEGDVYIYKRIHHAEGITCEQYAIFDRTAVDYMQALNLTCKDRKIKTPHTGNKSLTYACNAVDIIFFHGQADGTLQVLSKYKSEHSDTSGKYFEGAVTTIEGDGTIDWRDDKKYNRTVRITAKVSG